MSATTRVEWSPMEKTPEEHEIAAWLANQTKTDPEQVQAEFVVDELIDAGYAGGELVDFVVRLTGLTDAAARALIAARGELADGASGELEASSRDRVLARNETMFREVNERLAAAARGSTPVGHLDVVCECSDRLCQQVFTISTAEYEWLRQDPHRFAVLPGHEAPAVEDVVERHPGFVVVEKHAETHGQVEASDPRA
jgi:hypothetical protein